MSSQIPETRYAKSGDVSIAYQIVGEGPLDLVYVPPISHLELAWENVLQARFFNRLASLSRLIMLNQRGVGMSDRVQGVPTLETRMDDIRATMDAAGCERAVSSGSGMPARCACLRRHVSRTNYRTRADELLAPLRSQSGASLAARAGEQADSSASNRAALG